MKRILILGGGTGGTLAANLLAKKLKASEAQIAVVSASARHMYQPGWLYVPFGKQDPRALSRSERSLLNKRVGLINGKITMLDVEKREVKLDNGEDLTYDYLIIATGSVPTPSDVPGLAEGGLHFYTEEASWRLHAALEDFAAAPSW